MANWNVAMRERVKGHGKWTRVGGGPNFRAETMYPISRCTVIAQLILQIQDSFPWDTHCSI